MTTDLYQGKSYPLGATVYPDGVNFCLYSKHADWVELLLFDHPLAPYPSRIIPLDPQIHKTFFYWHIFIQNITAGQVYAYRVHGKYKPEQGLRFDGEKVLLDPYGKDIVGEEIYDREAAMKTGDNCAQALRNVVIDSSNYDWEGDKLPRIPYSQSVIYELHVGGFTRHPNSGISEEKRGTFAGLIEKIPYLKNLGITAIELLPIHYFDPEDARPGLKNYWGYSTIGFFTPYRGFSSRKDTLGPLDEFRDMVKALHKAGIEVILDVVFNHTAEGNEDGPTISFRGIDNTTYYILEEDRRYYKNFSGCGNTFRGNHPIAGGLILNCLRYWVSEMHVDGFRFDLASVLGRDVTGTPLTREKDTTIDILWAIESDPVLAGTKLIAEAWDAAGLYDVGKFVELGDWFAEWNGPFRDDVRQFVKSDQNKVPSLAARILGSPDIYHRPDTDVNRSINFITCHDGFTLKDLVSYNEKHNEANQENSRDGANDNFSWNCGVEGATDDPQIEALRLQQVKNFLTILLVSQGTPMLLMGDEVQRTQQGNNNAYCQDNELAWFDWDLVDKNFDLWCFVRRMIDFSRSLALFQQEALLDIAKDSPYPHLTWHGLKLYQPDWSENSHYLAFSLKHPAANEYLHVMLNAYWKNLEFELPPLPQGKNWHRVVDTTLPLMEAVADIDTATLITHKTYQLAARSSVVLMVRSS